MCGLLILRKNDDLLIDESHLLYDKIGSKNILNQRCFWVFKYLEGMQQMATIKDVARDAGVSVGTVSNVLNGGKVSAERRHQVEASIKKLDYQVNTLAKGMRMQKTDDSLSVR